MIEGGGILGRRRPLKNPDQLFNFLNQNGSGQFRKKLTSVEAQRIMSILVNTIKKVELVTLLRGVEENLRQFADVFDEKLLAALKERKALESKYEVSMKMETKAAAVNTNGDGNNNGEGDLPEGGTTAEAGHDEAKAKSVHQATERIAEELRQSTKVVCRMLLSDPEAEAHVRARIKTRSEGSETFLSHLRELKDLVHERLLTTVEEERAREEYLCHIVSREKKSSEELAKLQAELMEAKAERNKEVSKRNEIIRKLKEELQMIKKQTSDSNKRLEKQAQEKEGEENELYSQREEELRQHTAELEKMLVDEVAAHQEAELQLRKKRFKIEAEVENWIQKYDQDIGEKQEELDAIQGEYDAEKEQLEELNKQMAELKVQYDKIEEERRIAAEKAQKEMEELMILTTAAVRIQSLFRGYKARKQLSKKGDKKGKGKKGGKKK
eukprot:Nk52_evm2s2630 gene=Nk52_evmTU2s2630